MAANDALTRRGFLRLAVGAGAVAAGAGCASAKPKGAAKAGAEGDRTLRIAQYSSYVPAYDQWFDLDYTQRWGDEQDVEVIVDHVPIEELPVQADAEGRPSGATTSSPSPRLLRPMRTRSSTTGSSSRRSWPSLAP